MGEGVSVQWLMGEWLDERVAVLGGKWWCVWASGWVC